MENSFVGDASLKGNPLYILIYILYSIYDNQYTIFNVHTFYVLA